MASGEGTLIGPLEQDLRPIWKRNGQSLIGGAQYGPKQGADFIEELAATIEELGASIDVSEIHPGLEVAVYVRHDNAVYLREALAGEPDLKRAAALFDRAADDYQKVLDSIGDGVADQAEAGQISAWLRDVATTEREVGKILLDRGQ
jgi:hypothetical protein